MTVISVIAENETMKVLQHQTSQPHRRSSKFCSLRFFFFLTTELFACSEVIRLSSNRIRGPTYSGKALNLLHYIHTYILYLWCVYVLHKMSADRGNFMWLLCSDVKKVYKKVCCMCRLLVLPRSSIKCINAFLMSLLLLQLLLLQLSILI